MKVYELIQHLQNNYAPDEAIVVAWWDQDSFSEAGDIDKDEWAKAAEYMGEMDWSRTHNALTDVLRHYLDNVEEDAA